LLFFFCEALWVRVSVCEYLRIVIFFSILSLYLFFTACPTNSDNAQIFIKEHSDDLVEDVIPYKKRVVRKIGIYPW